MIQYSKKYKDSEHLVVLLNKSVKSSSLLSAELNDFIPAFQKEKSDFDFVKIGKKFIFFVKENENLEKTRVFGHKIREQLPRLAKEIFISGENESNVLALSEGIALSNYQFIHYFKDESERKFALKNISLLEKHSDKKIEKLNNTIKAVKWARDMVNEPVSFLTATQLAKEIEKLGEEAKFDVKVLEKSQIEALKMGGILAVNKGSIDPPTFTILEYKPKKAKNKKPIVLVGKGIVYDTGGLSLKPTPASMDLMKSDMAGAACMAATVYGAALNKLDLHIIGLIPATDNRPGGNAYTPGDVITMYDGTTVEVLNTDAEGRMILADALAYSNKLNPELVIDAATLTGAAVVAVGTKASCLMGNADQIIMNQLIESGNEVHERLVQLPFWDDYYEEMKSSIADLKNIGSRYAGMITAGKFLEHFVKAPYVHLDIAGPAFLEAPENYKGKGGTGTGVRLLLNFLEKY
jgi:leucyl aminopeptidase